MPCDLTRLNMVHSRVGLRPRSWNVLAVMLVDTEWRDMTVTSVNEEAGDLWSVRGEARKNRLNIVEYVLLGCCRRTKSVYILHALRAARTYRLR